MKTTKPLTFYILNKLEELKMKSLDNKKPLMAAEHKDTLARLKEAGLSNVIVSLPFLMKKYGLSQADAGAIILEWMDAEAARMAAERED